MAATAMAMAETSLDRKWAHLGLHVEHEDSTISLLFKISVGPRIRMIVIRIPSYYDGKQCIIQGSNDLVIMMMQAVSCTC